MSLRIWTCLIALWLPLLANGYDGVTSCLDRGLANDCDKEKLQHAAFKSVVLPYVDPGKTGLGNSLASILSRELLEGVSDQPGAGIIQYLDNEGRVNDLLGTGNVSDFLAGAYHDAAQEIGKKQNVQMMIWGAVLRDGPGQLFVENLLTLRETEKVPWNRLQIEIPVQQGTPLKIEASISHTRINLPGVSIAEDALFKRNFVVRCDNCSRGANVRSGPTKSSPVHDELKAGTHVSTLKMEGQYFQIEHDVQESWIYLGSLEMLPHTVWYNNRTGVELLSDPGGDVLKRVKLDGKFEVLDTQRDEYSIWYKLKVGERTGWVSAGEKHRRSYTFSSIHLIAGMYRFGRGNFSIAIKELDDYIALTDPNQNVILSVAHRFLAASYLKSSSPSRDKVLHHLDAAVEQTPFSAGVYTLRALVKFGSEETVLEALDDLESAMKLDRRNAETRNLVKKILAEKKRLFIRNGKASEQKFESLKRLLAM